MGNREHFTDFGFFNAWKPDVMSDAQGDQNGTEIDMIGYDTATVIFAMASYASAGAQGGADITRILLQHGLASTTPADGASAYSLVPGSQIIGIVYGGYDSTASTGIIGSWMSKTELVTVSTYTTLANASGAIIAIGYKKDNLHRFLRIVVRNSDAASAAWGCGIVLLGEPANWAVNTPINIT